jgi:hypothetical protein
MNAPSIKKLAIEQKLQALREEWKTAKISRRQIILIQARALKLALSKLESSGSAIAQGD